MAIRKFLTSVADVYGYDQDDNILFTAKTLLDSSIEVSLGSNPVRGGRGNQLQYVYYHTGEMNFTLTDAQWNLALLSATVGSDITHNDNVYIEEEHTLTDTTVTVNETPLAFEGETIYGWVTNLTQNIPAIRVTFNEATKTTNEDVGEADDIVCVRYFADGLSVGETNSFTVTANMIPKVVKLVMEAQLNSADVSTNKIGIVQIIAPRVTLSGAFTISMTSDGVSNTPLKGMALAYTDPTGSVGCSPVPYYAKMIEIIDTSNWYDVVKEISIVGGDVVIPSNTTNGATVGTMEVLAIPYSGASFTISNSYLNFTSAANTVDVGLHTGIVSLPSNAANIANVAITATLVRASGSNLTDSANYSFTKSA